jgi:hypothetical protein
MPEHACRYFYVCTGCSERLEPKLGVCCCVLLLRRHRVPAEARHRGAMTPAWRRDGGHRASRESSWPRDGRFPARESATAAAAHPRLLEPRGARLERPRSADRRHRSSAAVVTSMAPSITTTHARSWTSCSERGSPAARSSAIARAASLEERISGNRGLSSAVLRSHVFTTPSLSCRRCPR